VRVQYAHGHFLVSSLALEEWETCAESWFRGVLSQLVFAKLGASYEASMQLIMLENGHLARRAGGEC